MRYSELTLRYFEAPECAGELAGPRCYRGAAGSRAQGAWVQFDLAVTAQPPPARIEGARFLAFGCPHLIAVAAWMAERAAGLPARPGLPEGLAAVRERFGIPIEKTGRLLIVEDAWNAALRAANASFEPGPPS